MRAVSYFLALAILMPSEAQAVPPASAGCLIVGDSVAQGLASYHSQCKAVTKVGASSARILRLPIGSGYSEVVISAGSNDPLNPKLGPNLWALRKKFPDAKVTWVAPRNSRAAQRVYETAVMFHDRVVYLGKFKSNDGIHPKDYKAVAKKVW